MRRGDLVSVALHGDVGKPRPALVIQSDIIGGTSKVLVIPLTSKLIGAAVRRFAVAPDPQNGLRSISRLMLDRVSVARRDKCGAPFGRMSDGAMEAIGTQLSLVFGLTSAPAA